MIILKPFLVYLFSEKKIHLVSKCTCIYIVKKKQHYIILFILTAMRASSKVAEKASIRQLGMLDIKPTVSMRRTFRFFNRAWCTVTSNVANSRSSGVRESSSDKAFIRVVFPWKWNKRNLLVNEWGMNKLHCVVLMLY